MSGTNPISAMLNKMMLGLCKDLETVKNTIDKDPEKAKRYLKEMIDDIMTGVTGVKK